MNKFANLDGLNKFRKRLENLKTNLPELANQILIKVCEYGTEYAKSLYQGSANVSVTSLKVDDYHYKIMANGDKVAYLEFGTGERGRGSYEGKLPDQTISFYSNRLNQEVTLNGWVYSYAHELDNNEALWGGFAAKAQMWKTAQYIRKVIPQIIKEVDIK